MGNGQIFIGENPVKLFYLSSENGSTLMSTYNICFMEKYKGSVKFNMPC